ncbi:acetyltransferase [Advenella sp. S44]|uniref:acetyltransferase n=1 Tax=Advenella sp. S44 TaxID=1982755 RepID=UPI000C29C4EF|nr:acetyltransferase [Advenella sp. S44]PJX20429.1 acetyltransferase [Advenella sp. S44]
MKLRPALRSEFENITKVWEASVRATHDFLSAQDVLELRGQILNDWLPSLAVTVFTDESDAILGFSGVADEKLEMLFVAPSARGRGVGRALLNHAVSEMSIRLLDVNEQNGQAVGFYRHAGFESFGRSPVDGQGRPYPLLHMRLVSSKNLI